MKNVSEISRGVWLCQIDTKEIHEIAAKTAGRTTETGMKSVIELRNPVFSKANNTIEVSISDFSPLAVGRTKEVVLIDQSCPEGEEIEGNGMKAPSSLDNFIQACRREGLPKDLIEAMRSLLEQVSKRYSFSLSEGKARKWTAKPNFVAISIQNRNKQFLVSVKGRHEKMSYTSIFPSRGIDVAP